ncbi:MAG: hypothetical protein Q9212_006404 [Teloschistes hypoglaucus]
MAAEKYTVEKMSQQGRLVDRELREDELPFEFEGTGPNRGFYIDVGQLRPALTWAKLRTTMRALETCGFRRQIYRAIDFEIWEASTEPPGEVQIGFNASILPVISAPLKENSNMRHGVVNAAKMG